MAASLSIPAQDVNAHCKHCGSNTRADFCCVGCETAYGLLRGEGLAQYYAIRGARGWAVPSLDGRPLEQAWLDEAAARIKSTRGLSRVNIDVQGIQCAACVWLIESLFAKEKDAAAIEVNPALGTAAIVVGSTFDLSAFASVLQRIGYALGAPRKQQEAKPDDLLWRMGVCSAIAMNAMSFAVAEYAGLSDPTLLTWFRKLTFIFSIASVAIGGSVFFESAYKSVRAKAISLDLPIALGIVLAFSSSAHSFLARANGANYLDTLNVFIALMLVGRWLQRRVIERSRNALLSTAGIDQLLTRKLIGGRPQIVPCASIVTGDELFLSAGDLVPVRAELTRDRASFSLDWITGESEPRGFLPGDEIPAGAFLMEGGSRTVKTLEPLAQSELVELLHAPPRNTSQALATKGWQRFATFYVLGVLAFACAGFVGWWAIAHDLPKALDVTTAILIVTCPCAFGIAAPLAQELAHARLRRAGLFPRDGALLDRVDAVEAIVFDKTGTLTTGHLALTTSLNLSETSTRALQALVTRSTHPKSRAIAASIGDSTIDHAIIVNEVAGSGLWAIIEGVEYRLGKGTWLGADTNDLCFRAGGSTPLPLEMQEQLRPNAQADIFDIRRLDKEIYLLSGDSVTRAKELARCAGIDEANVIGDQTPRGKSEWLESLGQKALFVGDGINDSLAIDVAYCSGTPAVDRPFVASRAQFYFTTPGLTPITLLLRTARQLHRTRTRLLAVALAYNTLAIALSYLGVMTPLFCAVLMPLSSLSSIGYASVAMKEQET